MGKHNQVVGRPKRNPVKEKQCPRCKRYKELKFFTSESELCKSCGKQDFLAGGPYKGKGKNKAWKRAMKAHKAKQRKAVEKTNIRFVEPGTPIGEG